MQIIIIIIDMIRTQIQFSFFLVVCLGKILKTSLETANEQPREKKEVERGRDLNLKYCTKLFLCDLFCSKSSWCKTLYQLIPR